MKSVFIEVINVGPWPSIRSGRSKGMTQGIKLKLAYTQEYLNR